LAYDANEKQLFSFAIHDEALFHTLVSHYAASYNVRFETGDKSEMIYHGTAAAKLINERLVNPAQGLSNETITAVANLTTYEVSQYSIHAL